MYRGPFQSVRRRFPHDSFVRECGPHRSQSGGTGGSGLRNVARRISPDGSHCPFSLPARTSIPSGVSFLSSTSRSLYQPKRPFPASSLPASRRLCVAESAFFHAHCAANDCCVQSAVMLAWCLGCRVSPNANHPSAGPRKARLPIFLHVPSHESTPCPRSTFNVLTSSMENRHDCRIPA